MRYLAACGLLLAASAFAGEVDVRGTAAGRVSVRVTAAPLSDVLDRLARQTGMKVVYDGVPPRALVRGRQVEDVTVADAVADVLEAPFLLAARGHGVPRRTLLYRYALPAAANPLISLFGFSIGGLLSGALLIEVVMSWPGLGPLLLEAILARDLYLVIGGVLLSAFFLIGGNLLADMLLYWADPRIRVESNAR